jgi:hypothetical protein
MLHPFMQSVLSKQKGNVAIKFTELFHRRPGI